MNSPNIAIEQLNEITRASARDLPLAERCALYAGTRVLVDDLRTHALSEAGEIDGYLSEKLRNVRWHVGAVLGFDVDNGHADDQHRVWAYGALSTVRDIFAERFSEDD
ncbi:hypothetical protein MKK68_03910 [Methylobacterium sp. E-016]|uniref:hypothetical protein n=1 Tax=Methylobacterium sp. E-016 TaxID=2836556 RepID=UPI001FB98701|nr:hypothetical protein [Methylobacterium sp. E-016]MCJ2074797.1 hypothetical protein [Methylobacterium sp. E-016]